MYGERRGGPPESLGDILKRLHGKLPRGSLRTTPELWPSEEESGPECRICGGVGWLGQRVEEWRWEAVPCSCRIGMVTQEQRFHYAEFPNSVPPKTFDNFKPENKVEAEGLRIAREFVVQREHFILTLHGPNGGGKSHLLEAIGRALLQQGSWVKYSFVPDLLDELRNSYSRDPDAPPSKSFEWLFEHYAVLPEVLLLDDLGAESDTEWAVEKLTRLVDHRHRNRLNMVVGTNLSAEEMAEKLTPRIADRIFDIGSGAAAVATLETASWRTGVKWPPMSFFRRWRGSR